MTVTDTLDELERTIARTLAAKADQLEVDDIRLSPGVLDVGDRAPATVIHLTPPRPSRRRMAAVAAAVALLLAGAGVVTRGRDRGPEVAAPAADATTAYAAPTVGTAGFVPAVPLDGWSLATLTVGTVPFEDGPRHWQLFGTGTAVPLDRGVLVATAAVDGRVIEGANQTVQGQPARVGAPADPSHPSGAIDASWIDGDVVHDAIAVGFDEDELVAFLDGLVARPDPIDGFQADDAALPEVASATVAGYRTTMADYVGPGGEGDVVGITARSGDPYGGLLHRLDGVAAPGGLVRRGHLDGNARFGFVSQARDDGWSVEVQSAGSTTAAADPAVLDSFLASLQAASYDELVALAVAQPVTASYPIASGRTVELHGTPTADTALCVVQPTGAAACEPVANLHRILTASSLVVDGEWVLVTVTPAGREASVRTEPAGLDVHAERQVHPSAVEPEGQVAVTVTQLPRDAARVSVTVPTGGGTSAGPTYENPLP